MPNHHTIAGTMQDVVGTEERPYDRDAAGLPITRRWDLLACGHALPSRITQGQGKRIMKANAQADFYEDYRQRKCKVCQ